MATVWVVDDEAPVREVLEAMLQQMGHTSRMFADGASLLAAYQRGQTDLVISDMRMPGMDGLSLLRALREKDRNFVIALLEANLVDADLIASRLRTIPSAYVAAREAALTWLKASRNASSC